MTPDEVAKETLDRARRIETRLTKFMEHQGFDTKVGRPVWNEGVVELPSKSSSVTDMLSVVPPGWPADVPIQVRHKEHFLFTVCRPL
jgi:hypothetical protein